MSNARSFAPPGSTIELSARAAGADYVVSIADRGPGIPDAHFDRIFERFFTYRPGSNRRDHVGLGLAICRAIVEAHGGRIRGETRPGGGARFIVDLPLEEPPRVDALEEGEQPSEAAP